MKLPIALFILCLITAENILSMDDQHTGFRIMPIAYDGRIDLQLQSVFHSLHADIMPKVLLMDTTWNTMRAVLALRQACRLFHKTLNQATINNMISHWYLNGENFNANENLMTAVQMVPQQMSFAQAKSIEVRKLFKVNTMPELYLLAGANVNYIDAVSKDSPLTLAVDTNSADESSIAYITLLIRMGARVNHQGRGGNTALHCAVQHNALHCVELLLLHGADTEIKNAEKKIPLHCIRQLFDQRAVNPITMRILAILNGSISPEQSMESPIKAEIKANITPILDDIAGPW